MPQQDGTIIAESIYKSSVQNIFDKMSNYEMYQRFLYHTNSINTQNQGGIYCVAVQVSCGREICFGRPITRRGSIDFSRQELPVDDIKLSRWKCWKFWQTGESQMRGGERETFAAAVHSLAKGQQSTHKKDTLQCHKFETDKTIEN